MADIRTTKTVAVIGQSGVALSLVPGRIVITVENEGVKHDVAISVEEATTMGVQLLRMTTVLLGKGLLLGKQEPPDPETKPKPTIHLVGGS